MAVRDVVAGERSRRDVMAWGREAVEPELRAAVDTLPETLRRVAGFHFGWSDAQGRPTRAGAGKSVRSALTLLCSEAVGGTAAHATTAATSVELVHNFSLLHDDVMDGDTVRRHRPAAWRLFGVNLAILTGDALLTLALDLLTVSDRPEARQGGRLLGAAVRELVHGQSLDLDFEHRRTVELDQCVRMSEGKTAALLGAASGLGALFGGGDHDQVDRLRLFGERVGLAFQFADDLLGIWGDPEVTGKPVHSDLRSRKKSLPVAAALTSATPPGDELAALYERPGELADAEVTRAAELVELAGGREHCRERIDALLAEGLGHLDDAAVDASAARDLAGLAQLLARRDH
ncbi:polyprenyl synthetase family protein [Actinoalloteichus sp. AHMU CJ021]|uniref:polyprenyl synthetase family protein n=1 Tax=Actinoalloteichus TaxID=65496 RepID=UPI0004AB07C8|nr:polyprenyl synthetase family protein [Actinoalloteichus caeruleus]AUS80473.1 polyprenyl synthetase family protein [Actinoalloteichus sp. AHMU CJ021]